MTSLSKAQERARKMWNNAHNFDGMRHLLTKTNLIWIDSIVAWTREELISEIEYRMPESDMTLGEVNSGHAYRTKILSLLKSLREGDAIVPNAGAGAD